MTKDDFYAKLGEITLRKDSLKYNYYGIDRKGCPIPIHVLDIKSIDGLEITTYKD